MLHISFNLQHQNGWNILLQLDANVESEPFYKYQGDNSSWKAGIVT